VDLITRISDYAEPEVVAEVVQGTIMGVGYGASKEFARLRLPSIYSAGIRFALPKTHGGGIEHFSLPWDTYERGKGDCDQLVIYRIAELASKGELATCRALWLGDDLHVQVRRANGKVEDPAIKLGARVDWPRWLLEV
jgi:hypothetical protein